MGQAVQREDDDPAEDIADGTADALSVFMELEGETSRVLHDVPMLALPDAAPL